MAASDQEVFERFLKDPDLTREEGLLAFASYSADKYEWIAHREASDGHPPSDADVERWIRDLPDTRLKAIQDQAVAGFDVAARAYMQSVIEEASKRAVDTSILAEVKRLTSFGATFWLNVLVGVVSSAAFAFIVLAAAIIADKDPSLIGLGKRIEAPNTTPPAPGR